jgi:hypothetical protein
VPPVHSVGLDNWGYSTFRLFDLRFEVLMAIKMLIVVFWVVICCVVLWVVINVLEEY